MAVTRKILGLIVLLATLSTSFPATNAPPVNDNFENASILQADIGARTTFLGSTLQPGEPKPISNAINSLWWSFTAAETKSYSVSVFVDSWLPDPTVAVYRGDTLTSLIPLLNYSPVTANNRSYFSFRAAAGQTIRIQVLHPSPDAKALDVYLRSGPPNDDFQNALSVTNNIIQGTTVGATSEAEESFTQTVWYKWKPDRSSGSEFPIQSWEAHSLFIFEGDAISNLKLVGHTKSTLLESFTASFFADASKSYYIAVSALSVYTGDFTFRINQAPPNDTFLHRSLIQNLNEDIPADLTIATREPNEPIHPGKDSSHTLWYEWIAPATGGHFLETTNLSAMVAVYTGDNLTNLTTIPTKFDQFSAGGLFTRAFSFRATEGQTYLFAIHDDQPTAVTFRLRPGPPNDDFKNASTIDLNSDIEQSLLAATREPGEPAVLTAENVWHRFVAPADGTYFALTTFGGGKAIVFRGSSLTNLVLAEPLSHSVISFPFHATNGETLFISVAAQSLGYTLSIRTAPVNDNFADRLPLLSPSIITNAAGSTVELGEPIHTTNFASGSLWWTFTPTNSGIYRIQTIVPNAGSSLAIYTGTEPINLTPISRSDRGFIDFHAQAGVEYIIAATYIPVGNDPVILELHTPPAHDSFSAALPLTFNKPITNSFVVASREPDESTSTDWGTLWYSWTAPATGPFIFSVNITPDSVSSASSVFTGSELTNLVQVPSFSYSSNTTHFVAFPAERGNTYRFPVESSAAPLERTVTATILPGHPHDDLANAAPLAGTFVSWSNNLFGATSEPGEELLSPAASIWAHWTAPESGSYKIVAPSSHRVGVYHGINVTNLAAVAVASGTNTTLIFTAEAGTTYTLRITLAGYSSTFNLRLGPAAPNESLATATELTGDNISIIAQNWTATTGIEQYYRMLWFKWTAPAHGLITFSAATNTSILAYHTKVPTLNSNLLSAGFTQGGTTSGTNGAAVTAGVTYYFGLRAPFSTNIPFNLHLESKPVSLGHLSGALLGGDALWSLQTNVFFSAPDAFQVGPLERLQSAYIELVIYGTGTLKFRTKVDGSGGSISVAQKYAAITQYRGTHDWTARTINLLSSDYNVIRLSVTSTSSSPKPTAWLDDIEFTSEPPAPPSLAILSFAGLRINLPVQAGREYTIEISTDFTDWVPWTNFLATTTSYPHLRLPPPTNNIPQFFRARVTP